MTSLIEIKSKRLISILLITLFDLGNIFLILKLKVESSDLAVRGYKFTFSDDLSLNGLTIFYLIAAPLAFSYIGIINNTSRPDLVQILGPKSLRNAVDVAFTTGEFKQYDKTPDNLQLYFSHLAKGEPSGTVENLSLLYAIGTLVQQLIEESGIKSIKKVFMSDRNIPNAFTLRVLPIPFIGQDWIIINKNLVEILKPQEVKAVIAHEVGHAARYDSWLNTFISVPKWIIIFGWSIVFYRMSFIIFNEGLAGFSIFRLFAVFIFFVFIRLSLNIVQYLTDAFRRNSELLADIYAAELMGDGVILINALIKIARRAEVVSSIHNDLKWLTEQTDQIHPNMHLRNIINNIPSTEIATEHVRKDVIENYVSYKLRDTLRGLQISIAESDLNIMIEQACTNLNNILINQESVKSQETPFSILDWKDVDLDQSEYLEKNEINLLVDKLKQTKLVKYDPDTVANMGMVLESPSHPHINNRIILLHEIMVSKELSNKENLEI
ncbi:MAG: M48 family metalloprotease [Candidatus Heimdallarchaeota archaeon]|nr:M48 family metalloprotease [Candidatus Heimdallarchaeota archaeon]